MLSLRSNGETRDPALGELVEALRRIHAAQSNGQAGSAPAAPATNGSPATAAGLILPEALGTLFSAAARLHRPPGPESRGGAALYQALQERIRAFEAATAERHAAIDRLLDNGGTPAALRPTPVQETLYLQCARGGRTAGRFRCINRADVPVRARVRPGVLAVAGGKRVAGAVLTASPRACKLGPGAPAIVTVGLDLRRSAASAGDRLESWVEVDVDGACTLKVWLAVELYDPPA